MKIDNYLIPYKLLSVFSPVQYILLLIFPFISRLLLCLLSSMECPKFHKSPSISTLQLGSTYGYGVHPDEGKKLKWCLKEPFGTRNRPYAGARDLWLGPSFVLIFLGAGAPTTRHGWCPGDHWMTRARPRNPALRIWNLRIGPYGRKMLRLLFRHYSLFTFVHK